MGPPSPRAPQGRALERYGTVLIPRRRLVLGVRTQPHLAIIEQERRLFAQPKCPQRSKTTLAETVERSSGWTFWSRLRPIGVGHKSEQ
jgi:hypothetical protein